MAYSNNIYYVVGAFISDKLFLWCSGNFYYTLLSGRNKETYK